MERIILTKTSLKKIAAPLLGFILFAYFLFHLAHGERGYFSLQGIEQKISQKQHAYVEVLNRRERLNQRVMLLRPASLDRDLLEEQVRHVLGYTTKDDLIVVNALEK